MLLKKLIQYHYYQSKIIFFGFYPEHLVFIQGGSATPLELVRALTEHGVCSNLRGVRLIHMALEGDAPFSSPEFESNFTNFSIYKHL